MTNSSVVQTFRRSRNAISCLWTELEVYPVNMWVVGKYSAFLGSETDWRTAHLAIRQLHMVSMFFACSRSKVQSFIWHVQLKVLKWKRIWSLGTAARWVKQYSSRWTNYLTFYRAVSYINISRFTSVDASWETRYRVRASHASSSIFLGQNGWKTFSCHYFVPSTKYDSSLPLSHSLAFPLQLNQSRYLTLHGAKNA